MGENRKKLLRRRSIVENLIEKPPFHYEKSYSPSSDNGSFGSEETEEVINISLSGHSQDPQDTSSSKILPKQPCHTTINLYINDPHMTEKNWDKYKKTPPRRKMRNEIVLGKNIPDHTLMKNLLDDLGVKKYSSAPNMTNKYLKNKRSFPCDRFSSEKSFQDCTDIFPKVETSGISEFGNYSEKGNRFLYVKDGRSRGDFKKNNIEKIKEEDEKGDTVKKEVNDCPVHFNDHSVVRVTDNCKPIEEAKPQIYYKDPLRRFKRKPFKEAQASKNAAILYRDIAAIDSPQKQKLEQPRRKMATFNLRTQMVRDILNANPELLHSYQSGLMRNHKRLFDSLRHKNFQNVTDDITSLQRKEPLPDVKNDEQINKIIKEQSKLFMRGRNSPPICSVESHGSYEEYKKNLVKGPDGKMCCNNIVRRDDDVWSRAETRRIITSEFVKDKIKKFDKLFNKKVEPTNQNDGAMSSKTKNFTKRRNDIDYFSYQGTLSHNLLNEESVSFPKETKNAMTRLLSKNSQMYLGHQDSKYSKTMFRTLNEIKNSSVQKKDSTESSTSCEDSIKSNDNCNRCWPGVAERVRSTAEGNMT